MIPTRKSSSVTSNVTAASITPTLQPPQAAVTAAEPTVAVSNQFVTETQPPIIGSGDHASIRDIQVDDKGISERQEVDNEAKVVGSAQSFVGGDNQSVIAKSEPKKGAVEEEEAANQVHNEKGADKEVQEER